MAKASFYFTLPVSIVSEPVRRTNKLSKGEKADRIQLESKVRCHLAMTLYVVCAQFLLTSVCTSVLVTLNSVAGCYFLACG